MPFSSVSELCMCRLKFAKLARQYCVNNNNEHTYFFYGSTALVYLSLLIVEASKSHSETPTFCRTSLDE